MTVTPKMLRIGGALVLALLMMGAAYVLSGPSFLSARLVGAESTDELLAQYAAKDTDGDLLPDWQEALYGTDPSRPDTDGDGVTDADAAARGMLTSQTLMSEAEVRAPSLSSIPGTTPAPGSMTEAFSRVFFENMMGKWNGQPLSQQEQQALLSDLLARFSALAESQLTSSYAAVSVRTATDVTVIDYAASVEAVIRTNEVAEGSHDPVLLAQAFVENSDASAQPKLAALARAYRGIADGLMTLRVPVTLADEHLLLARSFDTLALSTAAIANYEKDPLAVLGALRLLSPASKDAVRAFTGIAEAVLAFGEPVGPGAMIVNIARSAQP